VIGSFATAQIHLTYACALGQPDRDAGVWLQHIDGRRAVAVLSVLFYDPNFFASAGSLASIFL
jgi:hypothetical protein